MTSPGVTKDPLRFQAGHIFSGRELDVKVNMLIAPESALDGPCYICDINLADTEHTVGLLSVRMAYYQDFIKYFGNIGYSINKAHRGHRYAAKAIEIAAIPLLRAHHVDPIIITCNPDNQASRRTCEIIGARLIEIVDIPETIKYFDPREKQKCRYGVRLTDLGIRD